MYLYKVFEGVNVPAGETAKVLSTTVTVVALDDVTKLGENNCFSSWVQGFFFAKNMQPPLMATVVVEVKEGTKLLILEDNVVSEANWFTLFRPQKAWPILFPTLAVVYKLSARSPVASPSLRGAPPLVASAIERPTATKKLSGVELG